MKHNVLIVEDNEVLAKNLKTYLELNDVSSTILNSWEKVIYELVWNDYDLIILDIWLPDISWIDICKKIREKQIITPILFLTSRSLTKDKIEWLDSWADDYLTKPFDYDELIARIKALFRRHYSVKSKTIDVFGYKLNLEENIVTKQKKEYILTKTEFDLLLFLAHNKWKILSKEQISNKVWWEYDDLKDSRKVDVYIWYIRKKLWEDIIETKRWKWYTINN